MEVCAFYILYQFEINYCIWLWANIHVTHGFMYPRGSMMWVAGPDFFLWEWVTVPGGLVCIVTFITCRTSYEVNALHVWECDTHSI